MIKEKTTFSFPDMFDIKTGRTKMISGLKATNSNIGLLLRTSLYELFGDPSLGSQLNRFLFTPNVDLIRDLITDHIRNVLEKRQTDIKVVFVDVYQDEDNGNTVHIQVDYQDLNTGQYCKNSLRLTGEDFAEIIK